MAAHEVNIDVNLKLTKKEGIVKPQDAGAVIAAVEWYLRGAIVYVGAARAAYTIDAAEHGGYIFTVEEGGST